MLSRLTNLVLVTAVLVLAVAFVAQKRVSQRLERDVHAARTAAEIHAAALDADESGELAGAVLARLDGEDGESLAMLDASLQQAVEANPRRAGGLGARLDDESADRPRMRGGDGREGAGPGERARAHRTPPHELAARCLEVAREVDAELGQRLTEAFQKNPAEFERAMRSGGFGRRMYAMAELKTRDPELYRAKVSELSQSMQIERTAKKWREALAAGSVGEADVYEAQLRSMLQVQFAMTLKARADMLCRLEDRIAELRDEIARDAGNFNHVLDLRMQSLAAEPMQRQGSQGASQASPVRAEPADTGPRG